jgi:membrane associated rhomboid family serine protease
MLLIVPVGDDNPRKRIPAVNYLLLAANLFIFFYLFIFHGRMYGRIVWQYGLIPELFRQDPVGQGWKLVTSLFLHGGHVHLLGNMLFLWIAGDNVEDRLGHVWYLFFYLVAGIVANVGHVLTAAGQLASVPCIGASGAVAGALGAYMVWFPRRRIRFWYFFFFLTGFFTVPSLYAIGFWFAQQLYLGRLQMAGLSTGVAYWAHIGGFAFGMLLALGSRAARALDRLFES